MNHRSVLFSRPIRRALVLVGALTLLISACGTTDGPLDTKITSLDNPLSTSTTARLASCHTADLEASTVAGNPDSKQGSITIKLANKSNRACSVDGYPTVSVFGGDREITKITKHEELADPVPVEISGDRNGYFELRYSTEDAGQKCASATRLVITPPDESATLLLPLTNIAIPSICTTPEPTVTVVRFAQ